MREDDLHTGLRNGRGKDMRMEGLGFVNHGNPSTSGLLLGKILDEVTYNHGFLSPVPDIIIAIRTSLKHGKIIHP